MCDTNVKNHRIHNQIDQDQSLVYSVDRKNWLTKKSGKNQ